MTNPCPAPAFRADAATILRAAGRRRLVIVAPHPDDETLGCGLLIAAAVRAGVRIAVVALTDGDASHASRRWPPAALARVRRAEFRRALARLGAGRAAVRFMGWPDGDVATRGRARALRRVLTELGTGVVVAASPRDHHPDHQAGWRLSVAATKGTAIVLASYAVWSRVDAGGPRAYRDVAAKRWAARAHRSQVGGYIADDPRGFRLSPGHLARFTGEAEVFASRRPVRPRVSPGRPLHDRGVAP